MLQVNWSSLRNAVKELKTMKKDEVASRLQHTMFPASLALSNAELSAIGNHYSADKKSVAILNTWTS